MGEAVAFMTKTEALKHVIVARLIAGVPLLGIGVMHLIGAAPMRPILEGAGIPLPGLNAVVAPLVEVAAGLMLLAGAGARIGGVLGAVTMLAALYAHAVFTWDDEPPIVLPIAVLAACLYVAWRGGGAWSVDARGS